LVAATAVTGRPRPDVPHLDRAPPTSSYPSGHVGASVALYASFAIMATSIEGTWLRRIVIGVCSVIPVLVAYARLYLDTRQRTDLCRPGRELPASPAVMARPRPPLNLAS
jgi:membrane-associated phospholipid phosphatase